MKRLSLLILALLLCNMVSGQSHFRIINTPNESRVQILCENQVYLQTPAEGVWTLATGWHDRWPAHFHHALIDSVLYSGPHTVVYGTLSIPEGEILCRDAYRLDDGRIRVVRRFEWMGSDTLRQVTMTVRFQYPATDPGVVLPGILYHGNPSGEKSGRTPWYHGDPGDLAIFEEHRYPMPFASAEWEQQGTLMGAAMHSLPSPVPYAGRIDQWWSLGVLAGESETELLLLSGPCGFNGKKGVIKAFQGYQGMFEPYDQAWMDLPPGAIVEKTFFLEAYPVSHPGSGFQHPVHTSLELFQPGHFDNLPTFREIVENKLQFAYSRYYEEDEVAGFKKYPDRNYFVLGWCGQASACGYALQVLDDQFTIPSGREMVQKSLDFLSTSDFYESGFYTWYAIDEDRWFMNNRPEWLSQGQAMLNFAHAIAVAKEEQRSGGAVEQYYDIKKWEEFLKRASVFHSRRILEEDWKPESTNEAFFIAPLCESFILFKKDSFLFAARKAAHYYAKRSLNMKEPYWGGTLDASCEDKEGAFAALQGFLTLYETTGDTQYLQWAEHAADVCLSYTVVWDIPMPAGRLTDHGFKSRGWTAVSVQNMHIDVYGVLIAPYVYRLGQLKQNTVLKQTGLLMFRTCGQLIDPFGSQGEQPYHTNYIQTGWQDKPVHERRGNYLETWTVFWITAHFLQAAALFTQLGITM